MPQPGLSSVLCKELLSLPTFTMVLTLVIQGTAKNMETIISWESHNYEDTFHLSLLPEAVSIDCHDANDASKMHPNHHVDVWQLVTILACLF